MLTVITASAPLAWPAGVLAAEDRARFARYAEALAFYEGGQWLGRPRRGETRLTFNYARAVVRKTAAYVYPAPVTFTILPEGDDAVANAAEQTLAALAAELDLARLDVDLCIEASVLGDAAVKVTWDAAHGRPEVAPVDPATVAVTTAPDNPRRMRSLTQVYALDEADAVALFGLPGPMTGNGRPVTVAETWSDDRWRVEVAGQVVRDDANPYGWIPYVILPNGGRPGDFWGESDLVDLYDPCRELNTRLSTLSRVLDLSGAPIAVLENVDGSEGISVGPGAKWELPEGARAYLLDLLAGGGVGLHVQYIDLLFRTLHDLSETPRTAFGDSGRDLSGAALEVEVQPLVQKVARKRRGLDAFYRARNARLLDLLERFGGARPQVGGLRRTVTVWPSPLPSDLDASVQNAARLVASGIHSRRTAVAALGGGDPEGEWRRVLEEARVLGEGVSLRPEGAGGAGDDGARGGDAP
jgi:hypothetical protein